MENKVLEKNIDRIKQYDSKLANAILTADFEKSNLTIGQTLKGEYNILLNDIPLHSIEGAIDESNKIVSLIEKKENTEAIRIVYGFGLGYLVDTMCESIKGKIIIYEPDIALLALVFSIANVDALFKDNVFICSDKRTFSKLITTNATSDCILTLNALPSYKKLYENNIKEIITIAQRARGELKAQENTYMRTAPWAIKNTFLNLKYLFSNVCISDLKDIYKGKTALCLSAGPSLRKNIEVIKKYKDKCIIFAVNPTVKLLKEFDIIPDFVVTIEALDASNQIGVIDMEKCCLITDGFTCNNVVKLKTGCTINYISDGNFLNYLIKDCMQIDDILYSKGTVSYTAFMSAQIMGFEKIIICGQDLAYQDGKCYAAGSQFEELECVYDEASKNYVIKARDFDKYAKSFISSTLSLENSIRAAKANIDFFNKNLYTVKSQDGKDMPTQTGYALFIDWFSDLAYKLKEINPEIKLINSSTGGAQIDGFENIELEKALQNENVAERIDVRNYKHSYDKEYAFKRLETLKKYLAEFLDILKEFNSVNNKTVKEIEIKKILTPNLIKLIQKHEDYLFKVLNTKNNPELKDIILIFLNKYIQVVDKDYYTDLTLCKNVINQVIKITDEIIANVEIFIKNLADCESLISQ